MSWLLWIMISLHGLMIVNALLNAAKFSSRRRARGGQSPRRVSVLVPARDEEHNLPRLLASFAKQDHLDAEMLVYDDQSTDATWDIIQSASGPRIKGFKGGMLPDGWVGKTNGCYRLSLEATGDVLLFIDADTEFQHPAALRHMCERFEARPESTMLTGMTLLKGRGQLIVTMVGNLILCCIPWWLGRRVPFSAMSGVNGQCWMITTEEYRRFEPHDHVRGEVLEDINIGRYLHKKGLIPLLDDVRDDLAVYMYSDFHDAWLGFRKNTASILGPNTVLSLFTLLGYIMVFIIAPILFPWLILSLYVIKFISDRITRQPVTVSLLAPVSYVLTVILSFDSIITRARGAIEWKGRSIP